jgi:hypothetical protein
MNTRPIRRILSALGSIALLVGCSGGGGVGSAVTTWLSDEPAPPASIVQVNVVNALLEPIRGAAVSIEVGGRHYDATTPADGTVSFANLPIGSAILVVSADGFETQTNTGYGVGAGHQRWDVKLEEPGSWAVGQAFILGTRQVSRAADGSDLTFSVDLAVINGEKPEPVENLTDANFGLVHYECGWGGPGECTSDAAGNPTAGDGQYAIGDGAPLAFGLQPASIRQPYIVGLLAERSTMDDAWEVEGPALKSFLATPGGNDIVGLASFQVENGATTLTPLGPFTRDGDTYFDAIDHLGDPAGPRPPLLPSLLDAIRWVAVARDTDFPGTPAILLVMANQGLSAVETDQAVAFARQMGVRISSPGWWYWGGAWWSLSGLAMRTGGAIAEVADSRQYGPVFGALDRVLSSSLPFYRIQFHLTGGPGMFVPGGNVQAFMGISTRTPVLSSRVYSLSIALPPN